MRTPGTSNGRRDELVLSIGGIVGRVELVGGQPTFIEQLRARYGAFEVPAATVVEHDFALSLSLTSVRPRSRLNDASKHPLQVKATAAAIKMARWDFDVKLARSKARGADRLSYKGGGRC